MRLLVFRSEALKACNFVLGIPTNRVVAMRPKQHETSIIRDIRRKIAGRADLEVAFPWSQIRSQQQRQRGWKLYSFHAPEVECIGRGKASAPYEFGVKASVVTTNARAPGGQFVLHARTLGAVAICVGIG